MEKNHEFSERLRVLIEDRLGIKHKDFAATVGVSPGYLSQVLRGKGPSATLIVGAYLYYGKHFHWLLTGEEATNDILIAEVARQLYEIREKNQEMFGRVVGYTHAVFDEISGGKDSREG